MFLFKNTTNLTKRIGMNMAVYGLLGCIALPILSFVLPSIIVNYLMVFVGICAFATIVGAILSVICFFVEIFSPTVGKGKAQKSVEKPQCDQEKAAKDINRSVLLSEEKREWMDNDDRRYISEVAYYRTPENKFIRKKHIRL